MTEAGETSGPTDELVVRDVPEANRYEARFGDLLAGVAEYRRRSDGVVVFTHTEVADEVEGRGIGGRLVRWALDDVRRRGLQLVPRCPFVHSFIERHPEYADLVAADGDRSS